MSRGRKGTKTIKAQAKLYSFRLWDAPEEIEYRTLLDEWLSDRHENASQSARLNEIIKVLMDNYQGNETPTSEKGIARLINRRLDRLEAMVGKRVDEILRTIIQNPRALQRMNDLGEKHQDGEPIADDFLDNILEDFGRE